MLRHRSIFGSVYFVKRNSVTLQSGAIRTVNSTRTQRPHKCDLALRSIPFGMNRSNNIGRRGLYEGYAFDIPHNTIRGKQDEFCVPNDPPGCLKLLPKHPVFGLPLPSSIQMHQDKNILSRCPKSRQGYYHSPARQPDGEPCCCVPNLTLQFGGDSSIASLCS